MRKIVIWLLLVTLVIPTVGCAPPASNIPPAANTTRSTPAQNLTSQNNSQVPLNEPAESPNASPAFTFTRSAGPLSTSNDTRSIPVPITPPGGLGPVGPLPPGGQAGNIYSVNVEFIPSQQSYAPGQTVTVAVKLTNQSTGPVVVTLPMKTDFVIPTGMDTATVVHSFPAGSQEEKLGVGGIITYNLTWDQKNNNGALVPPGWYFVDFNVTVRADSTPPQQWGSGGRTKLLLIQSAAPALVKTISLNQSINIPGLPLDVGGSTKNVSLVLTLKQVELSENGSTFFAVATSPDNPVSGYHNPDWAGMSAAAQYVVDGKGKDARVSNTITTSTAIELRWGYNEYYLDPIPVGTKELIFRITSMGDWTGPWEFKIPLQ